MSQKEKTTGEEFENFLSLTIKYKVEKKRNIKQIVKRVKAELEEVAKELNRPIEDIQVVIEWCRQGGRYDDELFVNLIAPLYRPAPKWKIVFDKETGQHIAILNDQR